MKLTKRSVDGLQPPAEGQAFYWDDELKGFGVRITANGVKTFILQGRVHGKTRRITLGRHGVLTPDQARDRARKELVKLMDGVDPSNEKTKEKALSITLGDASEAYLEHKKRKLKPRTVADIRRQVKVKFAGWVDVPLATLTREMVLTRFNELSETAPTQTNQAFRFLRAIWNYTREAHRDNSQNTILPENPCNILSATDSWNESNRRTSRVPDDNIGATWNRIQELRLAPQWRKSVNDAADAIALLMLSGARLNEVLGLRWEQVNLAERWWKIENPKNKNTITLPMSNAAFEILERRDQEGVFVFPARTETGHIGDIRRTILKIHEAAGVAFTAHDLRRTFRRIAGLAKVEYWKCKLLLNHAPGSDITLSNYTEVSDLLYLKEDVEAIAQFIEKKALEAKHKVIPLPKKSVA